MSLFTQKSILINLTIISTSFKHFIVKNENLKSIILTDCYGTLIKLQQLN